MTTAPTSMHGHMGQGQAWSATVRDAAPGLGDRVASARWIARMQEPDGAIPWFAGGHADPWDHVEAAMGMATLLAQAPDLAPAVAAAWRWLVEAQEPDGTWVARTRWVPDGTTSGRHVLAGHDHVEAHHAAHPAVGLAHLALTGVADGVVESVWPTVRRGLDAALDFQLPEGRFGWARGRGEPGMAPRGRRVAGPVLDEALVTANASILLSLRAGAWLADRFEEPSDRWVAAAGRLAHELAHHDDAWSPRPRFSMDWYWPVLAGAVVGAAAAARLASRWDEFVVPGLGIRCVRDEPWVTGAETCELVLALAAAGDRAAASEQLAAMQHLRGMDGAWWTGWVWPDSARWPVEHSTWTAGAMLLAADALSPLSPAGALVTGALPPVATLAGSARDGCATCPAIAR